MTSRSKKYPTRVAVYHHEKGGWIAIDQIRTIERIRVIRILDKLSRKEMLQIKAVIKGTLVD